MSDHPRWPRIQKATENGLVGRFGHVLTGEYCATLGAKVGIGPDLESALDALEKQLEKVQEPDSPANVF